MIYPFDLQGGRMRNPYADLEIRILGRQDEGYPVEITVNNEQEFPRGHLDLDFLPWVPTAVPAEDGERLFQWLFAHDALKTAWAEVRGQYPQRRIRLRIDDAAPELHGLPWELLREKDRGAVAQDVAAATATPFSRYLAGKWQPGSPILKRPIKILVAIANPQDLADNDAAPIDVQTEWQAIQETTADMDAELTLLPGPCTLARIESELKESGYHILHVIAHGRYSERRGAAALYLSDDQSRLVRVLDADFAAMLARQLADVDTQREDKLRLVFLASCQSATRSPADAFRGFAPSLVAAGVPAVLAMQDLMPVPTAQAFTRSFYRQILQHGLVDLACNEARSSLISDRLAGAAIPVLFMRLQSGQLLGQRGRISSERAERFWPFLLENIELGQCTPFIGPRANAGLLPDRQTIAQKLAERFEYPLPDRQNLTRVAQFIAIQDPSVLRERYTRLLKGGLFSSLGIKVSQADRRRLLRASLAETIEHVDWAERVLQIQENEIHHLLADLELPLYMTTNFDSFMVQALRYKGLAPRRAGPRWDPQVGSPQYVLSPKPSPKEPVVFYLNGYDGDPDQEAHMVLSEDDYLAHFVRLARDQEIVLPMNVLSEISRHSFLFLGYNLDDWEFRIILQGLLKPIAQSGEKLHVGVQLEIDGNPNADKVVQYFRQYLGRFHIEIYWGTSQQFVTELHARWREYMEEADDDWGF